MNSEKLVRMANQIAANFEYGQDEDKRIAGVVDHLSRFWTVEMRREIIEHTAATEASGLSELAAESVAMLAKQHSDAA